MASVKVFISYSHDTPAHKARVLELANALREKAGMDVELDQYHPHNPEPWPRWCERHVRDARFVLMVCTPVYRERIEAPESNPQEGQGVCWEADYIYSELYNNKGFNEKYLPVLLEENEPKSIPFRLRAYSSYRLQRPFHLSEGFGQLVDRLRGVCRAEKPPLGLKLGGAAAWEVPSELLESEPCPYCRNLQRESDEKKELPMFLRLRFSERAVDYVHQEEVWQAFERFYASPDSFSWWLIAGGAGSGKSRTALEFCQFLQQEKQWKADFISLEKTHPDVWHLWRPQKDTLLVIDYVARTFAETPRDIAGIFTPLARRAERKEFGDKRIRILLLEREYKERSQTQPAVEWFRFLDKNTCFGPPLELSSLSDEGLYGIATQAAKEIWRSPNPLPQAPDFLDKLARLDKKRRPLFAMLLSGFLAKVDPKAELSPNDVLDFAIEKEFERCLQPMGVDEPDLLWLLLLATCTGGKLGSCWLPPGHRLWNSGLGYRHENRCSFQFYPIEPDLLGERFVLKCAGAGNDGLRRFDTQQLKKLLQASWRLAPLETFDFFSRAAQNFASSDLEKLTEFFLLTTMPDDEGMLDIAMGRVRLAPFMLDPPELDEAPVKEETTIRRKETTLRRFFQWLFGRAASLPVDTPEPPAKEDKPSYQLSEPLEEHVQLFRRVFFCAKAADTLLSAHVKAGNFPVARQLFKAMTQLDYTPRKVSLCVIAAANLIFGYILAGQEEECQRFLDEVWEEENLRPLLQELLSTLLPQIQFPHLAGHVARSEVNDSAFI